MYPYCSAFAIVVEFIVNKALERIRSWKNVAICHHTAFVSCVIADESSVIADPFLLRLKFTRVLDVGPQWNIKNRNKVIQWCGWRVITAEVSYSSHRIIQAGQVFLSFSQLISEMDSRWCHRCCNVWRCVIGRLQWWSFLFYMTEPPSTPSMKCISSQSWVALQK